jgi:tetratricopeptide (TPR) repeat protein
MKRIKHLFFLLVLASSWSVSVDATDAEQEEAARQAAFRSGMQRIVDDLNAGSSDAFVDSIDQADLLDRVFGLRLIDQRVKKKVREGLPESLLRPVISALRKADADEGVKVALLGVESRGDRGRAVVRFDLPDSQFGYHEYDLRLESSGKVIVRDWTDFLDGGLFTENVGQSMVMAAPGKPATRKLLDFVNVSENELFQFAELLKAARDRKLDRYLEIRDGMPERFQRQRIVVETNVRLARQVRKRRQMVAGLAIMDEYYPDEPLYSLMLLDLYFPSRKYDKAFGALQRLSDRLDFPDAAMDARMSATMLVMDKPQEASMYAERALELEPGLELAWWSALSVRASLTNFAGSVEALQRLEGEFGYELGPEALKKNPGYAQLLESAEYKSWRESLK